MFVNKHPFLHNIDIYSETNKPKATGAVDMWPNDIMSYKNPLH